MDQGEGERERHVVTQQSELPEANLRPLEASLFSFHGFDDPRAVRRMQRQFDRFGLRGGTPRLDVIDDAVFVPGPEWPTRQQAGVPLELASLAGILRRDGQRVATADLYRGRDLCVSPRAPGGLTAMDTVEEMDEPVVYLGWLLDWHYGHFLLESLARVWFLAQVEPTVRVVFHHPHPELVHPAHWSRRMLAAFGVPPERIVLPTVPTRFRQMLIPEALFEMDRVAHERAAAPYQSVAARIAADVQPSTQPVYLSRRLLTGYKRQTIGEAELEDVLRENGFLVAHPETMTFEDQVRLINSHTDIFTSTGTAAHNALFALHQPRLHLLASGGWSYKTYFLCSALIEAPTALVRCLDLGPRSHSARERKSPEVVVMPRLVAYLEERGLLRSRLRSALAGRNPALRREYDEAWFVVRIDNIERSNPRRNPLPLTDGEERELLDFARGSWPVSLALAMWYARQMDDGRTNALVRQFVDLVANECDMNRLARYRSQVEESAIFLAERCAPQVARELAEVVSATFAPRTDLPLPGS